MNSLRPTFWRSCRALANEHRLRLLWRLFEVGGENVTALGTRIGLSESVASTYLRSLGARGLIQSERRSNFVFYRPVANPEVQHAEKLLQALRASYEAQEDLRRIIHDLTGFTHERRIAIVRSLQGKEFSDAALSVATSISPQALYRHTRKLVARGYVERDAARSRLGCPSSPLSRTLLDIALD